MKNVLLSLFGIFNVFLFSCGQPPQVDFSQQLKQEQGAQEKETAIDLDKSIVTVSPTSMSADAVSSATLTFIAKDKNGAIIPSGGASIQFLPSSGFVVGSVEDLGNGFYTQTLQSPYFEANLPTPISITATVNSEYLRSKPAMVTLISAKVSLVETTITTRDSSLHADGVETTLVTVTLKNNLSNNVILTGLPVEILSTAGTLLGSVVDVGDGTYTQEIRASTISQTAMITMRVKNPAYNTYVNFSAKAKVIFTPKPSYYELVFTKQPSPISTSLVAFSDQPIVTIKDNFGFTVTSGPDSTALITLSLFSGTGTLAGVLSTKAVKGVANFAGKGLNIDFVGTKIIKATKESTLVLGGTGILTRNSNPFEISSGLGSQIIFATPPPDIGKAGIVFTPPPVVHVVDIANNLVEGTVDSVAEISLTIDNGTLSGPVKVRANGSGVATFSGLYIKKIGTYKITATKADTTATGGTVEFSTTSNTFTIVPGPEHQFAWVQQPQTTAVTLPITPDIKLNILDAYENLTLSSVPVTMAIVKQPTSTILNGVTTVNAVNGVVTFPGLFINTMGLGYTLQASAGVKDSLDQPITIQSLESSSFDIIPGTPLNPAAVSGPLKPAQISLSWETPAGGPYTYSIFRGTVSGQQDITPIVSGLTDIRYVDKLLKNGQTYFYKIIAQTDALNSVPTVEFSATPRDPPTAPTSPGAFAKGASILVTWAAPVPPITPPILTFGELTYNVYRSTTSGGALSLVATGVSGTSWEDDPATNLANPPLIDTTYYYKIQAVGGGGVSALTNEVSAATYGPAAKLLFSISPINTQGGIAFNPQPVVRVLSAGDKLVVDSTLDITLAIGNNPAAGTLAGTKTVKAVQGVATFTGLSINNLGNNYTLSASALGVSNATSGEFNIYGKNIQVPIEMVQFGLVSNPTLTNYPQTRTTLNTAYYNGSPRYSFEVVYFNKGREDKNVYLRSVTSNRNVATVVLPAGISNYTYKSGGEFTPSGAGDIYEVSTDGTTNVGDVVIVTARIIVTQSAATKTAVYVPLLSGDGFGSIIDSTAITSGSGLVNGIQQNPQNYSIWKYDVASWGLAPTYLFEAVASNNTSGKTTNIMFELNGSSNPLKTLTVNSTNPTYVSGTINSLNSGSSYGVYLNCSGGRAEIYKAGLYVILNPINLGEVYYRLSDQKKYSSSDNRSVSRAYIDTEKFSQVREVYLDSVGYMASGLGVIVQLEATDSPDENNINLRDLYKIISSYTAPSIGVLKGLVRANINLGGASGLNVDNPQYYLTNSSSSGPSFNITQQLLVIGF